MYNKISGFSDEISSDINIQFEALGRLNIKYFEPRGVNGKNISALDDDEVTALKEKMDEYGIKVSSIGSVVQPANKTTARAATLLKIFFIFSPFLVVD